MDRNNSDQGNIYRIRIKGALDRSIIDWFGDITIIPQENGGTLLVGQFADQPALRGFLDQLWNLNFTVVSVEKVGNGFHQEPGL
jgi:hypothetical protein